MEEDPGLLSSHVCMAVGPSESRSGLWVPETPLRREQSCVDMRSHSHCRPWNRDLPELSHFPSQTTSVQSLTLKYLKQMNSKQFNNWLKGSNTVVKLGSADQLLRLSHSGCLSRVNAPAEGGHLLSETGGNQTEKLGVRKSETSWTSDTPCFLGFSSSLCHGCPAHNRPLWEWGRPCHPVPARSHHRTTGDVTVTRDMSPLVHLLSVKRVLKWILNRQHFLCAVGK